MIGPGEEDLSRARGPVPDLPEPPKIGGWWVEQAMVDADMVREKLKRYGSLAMHGASMMAMNGRKVDGGKEGQLRAVASYAAGKLSRIMEQLGRGEVPDYDSWRDLTCYAMMGRYVTRFGGWP